VGNRNHDVAKHEEKKEELKHDKEAEVAKTPAKIQHIALAVGEYHASGTFSKDADHKKLEFQFKVEEGGFITAHPSETAKYSLTGVI
jgi:hypothetical protein